MGEAHTKKRCFTITETGSNGKNCWPLKVGDQTTKGFYARLTVEPIVRERIALVSCEIGLTQLQQRC